jgi:hypothetical protein
MRLDQAPLLHRERAGLPQDRLRRPERPHVVEERPQLERLALGGREGETLADRQRRVRDAPGRTRG